MTDVVTYIIAKESVSCTVPTETATYKTDYRNFHLQSGASDSFSYNKKIERMSKHHV